jgi:hypothetical protein
LVPGAGPAFPGRSFESAADATGIGQARLLTSEARGRGFDKIVGNDFERHRAAVLA